MERTDSKTSLRMKYSRRKSVDVVDEDSEEDLRSKSKTSSEETSSATGLLHPKQKTLESLVDMSHQDVEFSSQDAQKLAQEVEELKFKLEQERGKNLESQKQTLVLQMSLQDHQKIVEQQANKIANLNNSLAGKTTELEQIKKGLFLAHKSIKEKEEQLFRIKNSAEKEEEQLRIALSRVEEKLREKSGALDKERDENLGHKEKISNLAQSLVDASKMIKELEQFLSEETAKTKKLQKELEFVIQNVNEEKEELHRKYEEFKATTAVFLKSCDFHKIAVLRAVDEEKLQNQQ